jgi:hypothetical protein
MYEITLEGKKYISSKRAAEVTGYAIDYIGQLCRESKVEARQIGRNWYVLEDSIKEHRFGVQEKRKVPSEVFTLPTPEPIRMPEIATVDFAPTEAQSAWQPTSYTPQMTDMLPVMAQKQVEDVEYAVAKSLPVPDSIQSSEASSAVIAEMQSAWQDWFEVKKQRDLPSPDAMSNGEDLIESPEVIDTRALENDGTFNNQSYSNDFTSSSATPVTLSMVAETIPDLHATVFEAGEEEVPIHRKIEPAAAITHAQNPIAPIQSMDSMRSVRASLPETRSIPNVIPMSSIAASHLTRTDVRMPMPNVQGNGKGKQVKGYSTEARIIRERKIIAKRPASSALRALFIVVALFAVVLAVEGTGQFDQYLAPINSRISVIRYLGGESFVNKP